MPTSDPSDSPLAVNKHSVLIVDDHPIVREGLARLIAHEPDIEVCGGADNVSDALDQVASLRPDLVVVDISLRDSNGLELISELKCRHPNLRALVWSMFDEMVFAERALRAGAMGYVNKQQPIDIVLEAIRQVLDGNVYLSTKIANLLVRRVGGISPIGQDPVRNLSDREFQVFEMIGRGLKAQEIARRIGLSVKTVETHRDRVKTKLNLRSAFEVNRYATLWMLENG